MGSLIQLRSRLDAIGNSLAEFDASTQETIQRYTAATFEDDFIGPSHAAGIPTVITLGYPWIQKIVGAAPPTVGVVANASGGIMQIALTAASQKQDADLYCGDVLNWDATKSATFETRLAMSVLPTTLVEVVFGLRSAWIDGPDNATAYIDFQMLASGLVNCRALDGVTSAQSVSSGVTLVASAYHNFRFDAADPTNVGFYIDGVKVSPVPPTAPITFAATGATAILQPYFSCYKASGTGVGTMLIDSVQCGVNRS